MGKLSNALWSTVSELSVVVGPKTTVKAVKSVGHAIGYAQGAIEHAKAKRVERKSAFASMMQTTEKSSTFSKVQPSNVIKL